MPDPPSHDPSRLAWILGSSRSGSTWLARMLGDCDRVVTIDETFIGHHVGVWRPISLAFATSEEIPELTHVAALRRDDPNYIFADEDADLWRPALRQLILAKAARMVERADELEAGAEPPTVVVKEPGASQVADWLLPVIPESHVIFLLRDGRDVVDSWVSAYRRSAWAEREGFYPLARDSRVAFVRWQAAVWLYRTTTMEQAFRRHDPDRRTLVRYEDLRSDPVAQLGRIRRRLGIPGSPEEVARTAERFDFERVPEHAKGPGRPINAARSGGWRDNLTRTEQEAMNEVLGAKVAELGYDDLVGARDRPDAIGSPGRGAAAS